MSQESILVDVVGFQMYYIIEFIGYFIFALAGACINEAYKVRNHKEMTFSPIRVVLSTVIGSLSSLAFKEYLASNAHQWRIMILVSFVFGMLGFEIFLRLSTIKGIKSLCYDIRDILSIITGIGTPREEQSQIVDTTNSQPESTDKKIKVAKVRRKLSPMRTSNMDESPIKKRDTSQS